MKTPLISLALLLAGAGLAAQVPPIVGPPPFNAPKVPTAVKPGGGGGSGGPGQYKAPPPPDAAGGSKDPTGGHPTAPQGRPASAPTPSGPDPAGRAWGGAERTGGSDLDALTEGSSVDDWWIWWEINKSAFLIPTRELHSAAPAFVGRVVGAEGSTPQRSASLRSEALPLFFDALGDDAAPVRAAAATALGRLGGDAAVKPLVAALDDPVQSVREAVLLALGATGTLQAADVLLQVAEKGHVAGGSGELCPAARPLALLALGIGRRHGLPSEVDMHVGMLAQDPAVDADFAAAGLIYATLAQAQTLDALVEKLSRTDDLDIRLRCRVTESLRLIGTAHMPLALEELGSPNADRRRSAAVALSRATGDEALLKLEAAFAEEHEPLTRGFLLVSVGERGGAPARDFLQRQLRRGESIDRPWVALALGLLARRDDDPVARETLRAGLRDEASAATRGAWILGCGLALDTESGPALREALVESADPRLRMFAALSLAMLRDLDSLDALRVSLAVERSPLARSGVVLGVALYGREADTPRLLDELRVVKNPLLQGQVAAALGMSNGPSAAGGLQALLAGRSELSDTARAAAIDALGLLLDLQPGFQLTSAAVDRNFAVFPEWLARALVSTTL